MMRRPPRSTLFPYTTALPIFQIELQPLLQHLRRHQVGAIDDGPRVPVREVVVAERRDRDAEVRRVDPVAEHALGDPRSEEHTSELQSRQYLVCRLLLEKKKFD